MLSLPIFEISFDSMTCSYKLPLHNSLETIKCDTTLHFINIGNKKFSGIIGRLESLGEYVHWKNFTILRISTIDRFDNLFEGYPSGSVLCRKESKEDHQVRKKLCCILKNPTLDIPNILYTRSFHLVHIRYKKLPWVSGWLKSLGEYVHRKDFTALGIRTVDR